MLLACMFYLYEVIRGPFITCTLSIKSIQNCHQNNLMVRSASFTEPSFDWSFYAFLKIYVLGFFYPVIKIIIIMQFVKHFELPLCMKCAI